MRIDQNNRYFVFDDGTSFIPIGLNLHKFLRESESSMNSFLTKYANHGINFLRIWLDVHVQEFENPVGSFNQIKLDRLDYLIKRSEELGIYISLCLFDENGVKNDYAWGLHPYNTAMGGPAEIQSDMYDTTDTDTWNALKSRYGNIVNRYENYRSIMMWDLINDTEKTSDWKTGMYDFVRNEDINNHIITMQYNTWIVPIGEMDCGSVRIYNREPEGNDPELMLKLLEKRICEALSNNYPVYVGEGRMGYNVSGTTQYDLERGFLHLLWGPIASGAAGNTHLWIEGNASRPYPSEQELDWMLNCSRFCNNIDWKNFNSFNVNDEVQSADSNVIAIACRDTSTMLIYFMNDAPQKLFNKLNTNVTINEGLINQSYIINWIDIRSGDLIEKQYVAQVPFTVKVPIFIDGIFAYISSDDSNISEVESYDHQAIPTKFSLDQNYPNPFNPITKITYNISERSKVKLDIYDILGRHIGNIVNKEEHAGQYTVDFDAMNLCSGTYWYILTSGNELLSKKMLLVK